MDIYHIVAFVIVLTTLLNILSRHVFHLSPTVGMMLAGLLVAVGVAIYGQVNPVFLQNVTRLLASLNFDDLLLKGMLGFLLFAGARQIDLRRLTSRAWPIGLFALGGVLISAFIIGGLLLAASNTIGLGLTFLDCLLFGAVISPTDPIAVLAILRQVGAPQNLEMDIEGESLFNDGIGVVLFVVVTQMMSPASHLGVPGVLGLFLLEAIGGMGLGFVFGFLACRLLRNDQDARMQVLLTLCIASGGYLLAGRMHMSGPLAMVVAGIYVGNHEKWIAPTCRAHLDNFWDVVDEIGNAILFMLVGLELLLIAREALPHWHQCLLAGALAVPLVLLARWGSLLGPRAALARRVPFAPGALMVMTWGGLRGGLPLAMALCVPASVVGESTRATLLMMTYTVVVFSILIQGGTVQRLVRHYAPSPGTVAT
jgi:CPA1 family monovalent cation:H+ antiporter